MVIHNLPLKTNEGYVKLPLLFKGSLPFIETTLFNGNKVVNGYFEFDTGSNGSLWINKEFANDNGLYGTMKKLRESKSRGFDGVEIKNQTVLLPKLNFGRYALIDVPIDLEQPSENETLKGGILGMDILKRFNVILDFQNDYIYLKPNSFIEAPYNKPFNPYLIFSGIALLLAALTTGFTIYRRGKSKR